jgi:hypothetical protein
MININVAEPCHESWGKMTPQDNGRHCDSCAQVVHDFTSSSKEEIKAIYDEHNGDICGRFHPDTLAQPKIEVASPTQKWMRRFCFSILLAFGTTLFIIGSPKTSAAIAEFRTNLEQQIVAGNGDYEVSGKLTRKGGNTPITRGAITITASGETVEIEEDGTFSLEFGKNITFTEKNDIKKVEVRITSPGYYSQTVTLDLSKSKTHTVNLKMERRMVKGKMMMGKPAISK